VGIAIFQLASKQVAWKVYSWVQQNGAIGNQNFLDTVGWEPPTWMVGWLDMVALWFKKVYTTRIFASPFSFPFLFNERLHSILFSLILTPNVRTLVCEWCMIKHEATSSYAITHFTCDIGSIDHLPYSISKSHVPSFSNIMSCVYRCKILIFWSYLFWNSIMCETGSLGFVMFREFIFQECV